MAPLQQSCHILAAQIGQLPAAAGKLPSDPDEPVLIPADRPLCVAERAEMIGKVPPYYAKIRRQPRSRTVLLSRFGMSL